MMNLSIAQGRSGPFRLRDLKNGYFQIHAPSGAFEGPKLKIFRKAVELGVRRVDLRFAVSEMNRKGHDFAEFGIGGAFLYTGKDAKSKVA